MPKMKTPDETLAASLQLDEMRKEIDYDTRDYSIDFLVNQFRDNEFFIPDEYQRRYIWKKNNKGLFIESVMLGLPIPFMFFADSDDGRCEIVDGAQRTQTLEEFMDNGFKLTGLKKLTALNGFFYRDLPEIYQRKFNKTTLRVVVLSEETTPESRRELFNRINTAGRKAKSIEVRRGSYEGPFMRFIEECANEPLFVKLCPITENGRKRYEDLELVLRFFAYKDRYMTFKHSVDDFLDTYVEDIQLHFDSGEMKNSFMRMLEFVEQNYPNGFKKDHDARAMVPRVRFEAIAVGTSLALDEVPDLMPLSMDWLNDEEFAFHTTTHASNSLPRVRGRIEYVRDALLQGR